eukprot:Phypoly_transcript_07320.p1 GENE.Phypoly_transcript_07320~~Phypoly_transcript_07320.p1  ORF type:complete len:350 (+),score=55.32 Phypoly_transcript_07320:564-1613(+)
MTHSLNHQLIQHQEAGRKRMKQRNTMDIMNMIHLLLPLWLKQKLERFKMNSRQLKNRSVRHQHHRPCTPRTFPSQSTHLYSTCALAHFILQLRLVEGQSSERAKTIELQEKEILSLRGKVVENEELVQRAMGMEGFMDQQMALLRQEHEEAIRQLKNQHSKEMEAEVDRHREELDSALTRAQLCLLSPSLPHNPPATQEVETLKKEKEELVQQRDNLQQKMQLVTTELEESAKSLVAFDARLSAKDEKIARLKDEIKSLYLSLNNVTESNQALKSKSKSMKRLLSSDPSSSPGGLGRDGPLLAHSPPSKPLFANPLIDKHWGLFYLASFGLVLVLHHAFSSYVIHNTSG